MYGDIQILLIRMVPCVLILRVLMWTALKKYLLQDIVRQMCLNLFIEGLLSVRNVVLSF